jgi:multidrug efflux pump subunit AcrB
MAIVLGKRSAHGEHLTFSERVIERITEAYGKLLERTIRLRWITIAFSQSSLCSACGSSPGWEPSFFPKWTTDASW